MTGGNVRPLKPVQRGAVGCCRNVVGTKLLVVHYPVVGTLESTGCVVGVLTVVGWAKKWAQTQWCARVHTGLLWTHTGLHWAALGSRWPLGGSSLLCPASALATFDSANNCSEIVFIFCFLDGVSD